MTKENLILLLLFYYRKGVSAFYSYLDLSGYARVGSRISGFVCINILGVVFALNISNFSKISHENEIILSHRDQIISFS